MTAANDKPTRTTRATEHDPATEQTASDRKKKKDPFCFTDPGCRTEVRLGALLTIGPIFLWMWLGPDKAVWLLVAGLPLLWIGTVLQAREARSAQRPGYPWKLGLAFAVLGALMIPDQMSRVVPGGALSFQLQAPALCLSGLWILSWWFYARSASSAAGSERDAAHG